MSKKPGRYTQAPFCDRSRQRAHGAGSGIDEAARAHLTRLEKARRAARDIQLINRHAARLNREAADVLEYQGLP